MISSFRTDSAQWTQAINDLSAATKRKAADILNQAAVDTAGYAFDALPPADIVSNRAALRAMLTEQLAQKVRLTKRGKRKGRFIPVGSRFFTNSRSHGKDRQLRRIHLMANRAQGRRGHKGLYGAEMRRYVGSMVGRRTRGVGFLKSVFIPVFMTLNSVVKYRFAKNKTHNIARWPGSAAFGMAQIAKPGQNPFVRFVVGPTLHGSKQDSIVRKMYEAALQAALRWKTGKMQREAERALDSLFKSKSGRR